MYSFCHHIDSLHPWEDLSRQSSYRQLRMSVNRMGEKKRDNDIKREMISDLSMRVCDMDGLPMNQGVGKEK